MINSFNVQKKYFLTLKMVLVKLYIFLHLLTSSKYVTNGKELNH